MTALWAQSVTVYSTNYNGFRNLQRPEGAIVDKQGRLVVENGTDSPILISDSTIIDVSAPFKYYARMANLHNSEGRTYKVKTASGTKRVSEPRWGVCLDDGAHRLTVMLSCSNENWNDEVRGNRTMHVAVSLDDRLLSAIDTDEDVKLDHKLTAVGVSRQDEGRYSILLGAERLREVAIVDASALSGTATIGIVADEGSKVAIERSVLSYSPKAAPLTTREWTPESLAAHLATSVDPYEGYWTYLDRELEDKWLGLGGRYTIALVANGNGYDILYIEGAQVMGAKWQPCQIKGTMTRTIFTDNYRARWIDATGEDMGDDVQAAFEGSSILNVKFPVFKSQLRFSKQR